ncbi:response regulator [Hyalangium minutum]|uniref:histidine kinase n=1 Tax=Hyalangium minutum TaxID=394096 RepID=A0A085WW96_9BACT|nr:response regulator [Hyalangium minutum]KFE71959.1 Histidine kinase [Hyalangium minutum]
MSAQPLRLLLVEDSDDDATLLLRELRRSGYDVSHSRVETREGLERALSAGTWDAVIADYALPQFDGLSAFALVRQRGLDVPFLIVSGKIGEDVAVAAMKAGVHDFVLKDRLGRLGPAVARELREAELRAERRTMQEQLMLSDRLASLGMLAASVAHELNNPLASVMMNLEFGLSNVEAEGGSQETQQALREAFSCAGLIRDIIRDIKIFSRPEGQNFGPTDVHRVLDSALRMAHNQLFHRAQLVKDYGEIPSAHGSEARLGQVLLNLIINAAHAIPEGYRDAHEIRVVTRRVGEWVRVEIHDTGAGVPPELRERIFEPFFTTKPVGVGTGLGLSICRRLVTEMSGGIGVDSEPGQGSTFWIQLRVAQEQDLVQESKPREPRKKLGVLVLDDEAAVGKALGRLLGTRHQVITFERAQDALAHVTSGHRFDAILCDLMMPEMSGSQFHQELERLAPEQAQRVIFMTGGAFTEETRAFLSTARNPCMDKPLDIQRLLSMLELLPAVGSSQEVPWFESTA